MAQVSHRLVVSSVLHKYVFVQGSPDWEDAPKPSRYSEHLLLSSLLLHVISFYPSVLVSTLLFNLNSFLPFLESSLSCRNRAVHQTKQTKLF